MKKAGGCLKMDRAAFERDGFLVVRGFVPAADVVRMSASVDRLSAPPYLPGRHMVYLEESRVKKGEKILSRIEKFVEYDDFLGTFVSSEKLHGILKELLGDEPALFKEKINFKMPGSGGFEPHQDVQAGWEDYAPYFLSVLVAIDDSNVENGCLELAAGHHKRGLIGRMWEPLSEEELKGVAFTPYPMAPGDVVFFDGHVPHRSKPNRTDKPRRNLYLTFNRLRDGDHRERYFADKRKNYPPDAEREAGKEYVYRV